MTGVSVGGISLRRRLGQISGCFHAAELGFVVIGKRMKMCREHVCQHITAMGHKDGGYHVQPRGSHRDQLKSTG